ncbi:hypothetical protein [Pelagibaculum spongiae]|uniref:Uncharacterized protein n=1 Tax=Pelagibaculum spongiae TaxID=2080658 RepID=A0A2V1GUC1_9GAMM|nr:hypothetical protein [Pelagibaculum spongiae]PVZ67640.1 hypothetical protein DC094_14470 [Pelagibaculum spongiae]
MAKPDRRNPFAFDPIMRKGGVHQKTNKAKRKTDKQRQQQEMRSQLNKSSWRCSFFNKTLLAKISCSIPA